MHATADEWGIYNYKAVVAYDGTLYRYSTGSVTRQVFCCSMLHICSVVKGACNMQGVSAATWVQKQCANSARGTGEGSVPDQAGKAGNAAHAMQRQDRFWCPCQRAGSLLAALMKGSSTNSRHNALQCLPADILCRQLQLDARLQLV